MSEAVHSLLGMLVFVALGVGLVAMFAAGDRRQQKHIERWASDNNYHLLKVKKRPVLLTPFRWDLQYQVWSALVYYVKVLTKEHRIRYAYIMIKGKTQLHQDDEFKVRWDEKHDQHWLS